MTEMDSQSGGPTIWFLITALTVGGAEQTLVTLVNEMDDRYDVTVWTIFSTNPLASDLRDDVSVRSLTDRGQVENSAVVAAESPLVYVLAPLRFWYAAATERPAVIQSFLTHDNFVAAIAGLLSPATVITGVRSVPRDPSLPRTLRDRITVLLADVVVSNSRAGAALAIDQGASEDSVRVINNGRPIAKFEDADGSATRAALTDADDAFVVGSVGRLIERKGYFDLLEAWPSVTASYPNARLVLVGDGTDRRELERRAQSLGCIDSVTFLGERRDVPELLDAFDVFVLPSHFEGFPGAVQEAMAAGLPIVATPVDGTGELLDAFRTGLFVDVEAPAEIEWALRRLLAHPGLRDELGSAARAEAEAEYSVEKMATRFEALYPSLPDEPTGAESGRATDRAVT